jgi:hypothetical protein
LYSRAHRQDRARVIDRLLRVGEAGGVIPHHVAGDSVELPSWQGVERDVTTPREARVRC